MYRRNIYAVAIPGNYARWIVVIAARNKAAAVQFIKEYNDAETGHYLPSDLWPEDVTEDCVKLVATDAAVDNEGILFDDGYVE